MNTKALRQNNSVNIETPYDLSEEWEKDFENVVLMIKNAHIKAYSSVNRTLIDLYFSLGKYISERVTASKWGKGVVKELLSLYVNSDSDSLFSIVSPPQ